MKTARPDYNIGSIYWLPSRDKIPIEHTHATLHIDSGCFDHPVVLLWVNPQKTEATVLIITSLGGKDLQLRHPHDTRARSHNLPIHPSNAHPDNGFLLFLKGDARLRKNSYVVTEPQRTVKLAMLEPTRHELCTLRKKSFNQLVKHIGFQPPVTKPLYQKHHGTNSPPQAYGEWPDLVAPAVAGRVKPPPERHFVVHVKPALPAQQIPRPQCAQPIDPPRPQYTQQTISPRQPPATPYIQHNAFSSPPAATSRTERTPLLQSVQPVQYVSRVQYTHENSSQNSDGSCDACGVICFLGLCVFLWAWWRIANP